MVWEGGAAAAQRAELNRLASPTVGRTGPALLAERPPLLTVR